MSPSTDFFMIFFVFFMRSVGCYSRCFLSNAKILLISFTPAVTRSVIFSQFQSDVLSQGLSRMCSPKVSPGCACSRSLSDVFAQGLSRMSVKLLFDHFDLMAPYEARHFRYGRVHHSSFLPQSSRFSSPPRLSPSHPAD